MDSLPSVGHTHHAHRKPSQVPGQSGAGPQDGVLEIRPLTKGMQSTTLSAGDGTDTAGSDAMGKLSDLLSKLIFQMQDKSGNSSDASNSDNSNPEEKKVAADITKKLDKNNDGKIDKSEFVAARPHDVSEADAGKKFDEIDADKKGSITGQQILDDLKKRVTGHDGLGSVHLGMVEGASTDGKDQSAATDDINAMLKQIMAAIEAYRAHSQQTSSSDNAA